jgi:hypothetical protein
VVKPKPSSTRTSATSSVAGSGGVVERERRSPRRPELIASLLWSLASCEAKSRSGDAGVLLTPDVACAAP